MELPKYLYLEVTRDKYSLPLHVCDSVKELSVETGVPVENINSTLCRYRHGEFKNPRFIEVMVNPDGVKYGSEDIRYNVYKRVGNGFYMLIIKNRMINYVSRQIGLTPYQIVKAEAYNDGFIKEYKIEKVMNNGKI